MRPIPFQLPDLHGGLTEIKGNLYLDDEFLVFDLETALLGEFDKEHQVIKIEPRALAEIRLDPGVFRDRLCVRPKKRDLLTAMPGTYGTELVLKIWTRHRARAEHLVADVRRRQDASA